MTDLFAKHHGVLEKALETARSRGYWAAYPEAPSGKIYGATAKADGQAAFEGYLGKDFGLAGHPEQKRVGAEKSPYGINMSVKYPAADVDTLIAAAQKAASGWGKASVETRTGICLEILDRLNKRSFEIMNAVMHTTGQAFMMAFQAGGPHAQDRGLEAVTYAYDQMSRIPQQAMWEKVSGKDKEGNLLVDKLQKEYRINPRGIAVMVGCATFPTWNGYPGLFASFVTGNPVIVKPHPSAVLPLAITISVMRDVLSENGFDPNAVLLAADEAGAEITKDLCLNPAVKLIDFTGSNAFGQWIRENAKQAQVYTEEAGVNTIVVDSTDNFRGMCGNIGFSLSLYSGQMCTAPQNIYVPENGIETDQGHKSFDEVAEGIKKAVDGLLKDPARAAGVCGAIVNPAIMDRVAEMAKQEGVLRDSGPIEGLEDARTATPLIIKTKIGATDLYKEECFGPVSFIIATKDTNESFAQIQELGASKGAITGAVYAQDEAILDQATDAYMSVGVNLSCNLMGGIFVNQSAAFSDFHVTGANPAGNASLTDAAYVADRFTVMAVRKPIMS